MKLYLIRHGSQISKLCNDNTGLSERGKLEIQLLGKRLSNYSIDAIYSSPLIRAVESAEIIQEEIYKNTGVLLEYCIRDGLQEMNFGELTGLEENFISQKYSNFLESRFTSKSDWSYPKGESKKEVFQRFFPVIQEIIYSYPNKNIAVVTHGWAIRSFLGELLFDNQYTQIFLGKDFKRGSFTEINYEKDKKRFYLQRFNDYAHLEVSSMGNNFLE